MNILLVDDDPAIRDSIASALEMRGHTVRQAATSWDAYAFISAYRFEAAIVDYDLGDGQDTGPNVLRAIKESSPTTGTCLFSGLDRPECEYADVQIVKSDPGDLLSWIEYEAGVHE